MKRIFCFLLLCLVVFGSLSCSSGSVCVRMPDSDSKAPQVFLKLRYKNNRGETVTKSPPDVVTLGNRRPFTMVYTAFDDGGVRQMALSYSIRERGRWVSMLVTPTEFGDDCPAPVAGLKEVHEWHGAVDYRFQAIAEDFAGNEGISEWLTVRHRR